MSLESKREADATPVTITLIGLAASLIAATPLKCQGINNIFNHDRTGKKDASNKLAKISMHVRLHCKARPQSKIPDTKQDDQNLIEFDGE